MFSRAAFYPANGRTFRQTARLRTGRTVRSQSTAVGPNPSSYASHVAAGVAGGGVVILAGYAYYHTSGLKTAVQTSKQVKQYLESTRDQIISSAKTTVENPSEALQYLRRVATSYSGMLPIPGVRQYVDQTFDTLDELHDKHGEDMDNVVSQGVEQLQKTVKEGKADMATSRKAFEILSDTVKKLQDIGMKVGGDLLERNPHFKEAVGGAYDEMKKMADKGGPETRKILEDTTNQLKDMMSKGKTTPEIIQNARDLLKEKAAQIKESVGSSGAMIAASSLFENGWENMQQMAQGIPGGEEALKKAPHIQGLLSVMKERSDDAKQLAQETWQDVVNILEDKGRKAAKLGKEVKDESQGGENKDKKSEDDSKDKKENQKDDQSDEKSEQKDSKKKKN